MIDDLPTDSYLLIPPAFQDKYGKYIKEECYNGYGNFGKYDVYELVAEFNKDFIPKVLEFADNGEWKCTGKGTLEEIKNNTWYKALVDYHKNGDNGKGDGYNSASRLAGIGLACYDEDNFRLPNPIKITKKPYNYNEVPASETDPDQGWYSGDDEYDDDYYC
jgi:hypothetical protein